MNKNCIIFGRNYYLGPIVNLMESDEYGKIYDKICDILFDGQNDIDVEAVANYIIQYINEYDDLPEAISYQEIAEIDNEQCEIIIRRWKNWDATKNAHTEKPTITCPYCGSTDVTKITLGKKVLKAELFGFAAASTVVHQWRCKKCKSEF